jgi:DNA mismatch endonuclease (patch repair protein)
MDKISAERRSWNMSRIQAKNSKPEVAVRHLLHGMGYRFRLHVISLPGRPDIVLPKYRSVVFVNGCFWHRHPGCKYAYVPKSRLDFWTRKFEGNTSNDRKVIEELKALGWKVVTIWECEVKDKEELAERLASGIG